MHLDTKLITSLVVESATTELSTSSNTSKIKQIQRKESLPFGNFKESDVVIAAKNGDKAALEYVLGKYKIFVKIKARSYFLIGADKEDLIQEGMIGLYKAIRDYCDDRQTSFKAFAELCITRQMITAIKTATRQKHIPLNSYISFNRPAYYEEESERTLEDTIQGNHDLDPIDLVINGEELKNMHESFDEILSDYEARVVKFYIEGRPYQEIADKLGRHVKSVDNALQRVKRKIELSLRHQVIH
ncbi:RNA polymerase sporulation sigma factor SigH [Candidatus Oleimmundimicrobium sp.]|uniref:RNA polymerase sporulation sigma factor SigH n=1 Tax=Candidatus Oleimmundimicrobium sp. TaxID=3060597 RepID=UPI00272398BC|nr:RNA polymerase sporulation sigma factor SigH [Candidatus Oleimmundimicrobium sp.]MDO8885972.1 RNA polymerase sporulation sigma factor SigH [Candidatus Oleimmundimicrobium sp.]